MSKAPFDWHYPRTELADSVLQRFAIGATTALTLFAPRRMGKTEFVVQDLLPLAAKQGYLDVYVNFWDRKTDPADSMIIGLKRATSKLKLADIPNRHKLDMTQHIFETLAEDGRRILLALDEVQHLATDPAYEPIVYALRGLIDTRRDQVHVLYTGSSRSGLQRLFKRRNAPLFSSSQQIDLPHFGRGYLEHIADVFNAATGRQLDINESRAAFKMVKKVPFDYRQIIDKLILNGGTDIVAITNEYMEENSQEEIYLEVWQGLKPIDQAVLRLIIEGVAGMYSQDARAFIAERLGIDSVDIPHIQNAVNRLKRASRIAPVGQGRYEMEDPYFTDWIVRVC